jgi:hypothetical protein
VAKLPRLSAAARCALEPGPEMDRHVWYALRRMPRTLSWLRARSRWPQPLPWSTNSAACGTLLDTLLGSSFWTRCWHVTLTYWGAGLPGHTRIDVGWTCEIAGPASDPWIAEGQGATLAEAVCRALLHEQLDEEE